MAYERRSFAGAAASTTLAAGIDASTTTVTIASATGWPDGTGGDFFIVIDRGAAAEEKLRVDTRSGTTLTILTGGRGADGTAAATHATGATVEVCLTAVDLDEANAHLANTALDHHTQYLNTARHDITARHAFGAALGTPGTPASIGTANSAGTGAAPAREDHVHDISTAGDARYARRATFPVLIGVALSDETTALTTGAAKLTVRSPFAFTLTDVRASVNTASTSGTPTVDINEGGTTLLSTKLTIDANEKTSTTAATPAVISDSAIADDAELIFDIDVAGTGTKGLKVWLIGTRVI